MILEFFASVGRVFISFLLSAGRLGLFLTESVLRLFQRPTYFRQILEQFLHIGYFSLPVVGLTALSSGMVLALQSYTGFSRFSAEGAVATVVVLSITRELGPVMAGLMVAGRMGASMAAEIATMRVTEQIDALTTLSTNPIKYLVTPRVLAGFLMLPLLVLVADVLGVFGGYIVGVYQLEFNASTYLQQTIKYLEYKDVMSGLIKASAFGVIITLMGCYHGYYSNRGAEGVGRATTNAVVSASVLILFMNYALTALLFDK
ncbi:MAG: ABC transporter permease [Candidatus Paracaedibacteraceae bacterium]|jgi:phospholipid/cholesterol/gamma-HCH transport system permease protein|nr:ABC transporter permease [Candidatus Paracaedibacteraceae bacterium]